ncbi:hypothetical protein R1sor_009525 [Riccia sorocarpa]|uniref:Uncharacterized protein n=1 Tax=Riccia sorocarpa TaxID=122646 RepID=A0ABD3I1H7_9MARC
MRLLLLLPVLAGFVLAVAVVISCPAVLSATGGREGDRTKINLQPSRVKKVLPGEYGTAKTTGLDLVKPKPPDDSQSNSENWWKSVEVSTPMLQQLRSGSGGNTHNQVDRVHSTTKEDIVVGERNEAHCIEKFESLEETGLSMEGCQGAYPTSNSTLESSQGEGKTPIA